MHRWKSKCAREETQHSWIKKLPDVHRIKPVFAKPRILMTTLTFIERRLTRIATLSSFKSSRFTASATMALTADKPTYSLDNVCCLETTTHVFYKTDGGGGVAKRTYSFNQIHSTCTNAISQILLPEKMYRGHNNTCAKAIAHNTCAIAITHVQLL